MVRAAVLLLLVACGGCGQVGAARDAGAPPHDAAADAAPDAPMIDGLVAWYRMDVATTGTVVDASGHHHDGTCDSGRCPAFTATGRIGGAYVFDGTDDLFHVQSAAELEGRQGFTITGWFNRADTSHACIINKSYQVFGDNSWQACVGDNNELAFFSTGDGTPEGDAQSGGTLGTARWYHVALWWDGSTKTKAIYLDGNPVASTADVDIVFDSADINIGSDIDFDFDTGAPRLESPFRGQVDDVRIYNRALSPDEIRALQSP